MQSEVVIWNDSVDDSFYGIGVRYQTTRGEIRIVKWFDIHIDGLYDIFGGEAAKEISELCKNGEIMALEIDVRVKNPSF